MKQMIIPYSNKIKVSILAYNFLLVSYLFTTNTPILLKAIFLGITIAHTGMNAQYLVKRKQNKLTMNIYYQKFLIGFDQFIICLSLLLPGIMKNYSWPTLEEKKLSLLLNISEKALMMFLPLLVHTWVKITYWKNFLFWFIYSSIYGVISYSYSELGGIGETISLFICGIPLLLQQKNIEYLEKKLILMTNNYSHSHFILTEILDQTPNPMFILNYGMEPQYHNKEAYDLLLSFEMNNFHELAQNMFMNSSTSLSELIESIVIKSTNLQYNRINSPFITAEYCKRIPSANYESISSPKRIFLSKSQSNNLENDYIRTPIIKQKFEIYKKFPSSCKEGLSIMLTEEEHKKFGCFACRSYIDVTIVQDLMNEEIAIVCNFSQSSQRNEEMVQLFKKSGRAISANLNEIKISLQNLFGCSYDKLIEECWEKRIYPEICLIYHHLINCLSLLKLDVAEGMLHCEVFQINEILNEVYEIMNPIISKNPKVELKMEKKMISLIDNMKSEKTTLRQILMNILLHALSFIQKGQILFQVERPSYDTDHVHFTIQCQIKSNAQSRHEQELENSHSIEELITEDSCWKGLIISNYLCKRLHGKLEMRISKVMNECSFSLRFPMKLETFFNELHVVENFRRNPESFTLNSIPEDLGIKAKGGDDSSFSILEEIPDENAQTQAVLVQEKDGGDRPSISYKFSFKEFTSSMENIMDKPKSCCPSVLIVDNNSRSRESINSLLTKLSIQTLCADNGIQALENIKENLVRKCCLGLQIIFLAIKTDNLGMSFKETARNIRRLLKKNYMKMEVYSISLSGTDSDINLSIECDVKNILVFPLTVSKLKKILMKHNLLK